jgi:hypothetical protein
MNKIDKAIQEGKIQPKKIFYKSDKLIVCTSKIRDRFYISDGKYFHDYHIEDAGIKKLCKDIKRHNRKEVE